MLPAEAQQIDRVLQRFAARYHATNPAEFANPGEGPIARISARCARGLLTGWDDVCVGTGRVGAHTDTAYILSFSIVMLNTDLHNPSVKNRMTKHDFVRNNRGINNRADFPRPYLEAIFNAIKRYDRTSLTQIARAPHPPSLTLPPPPPPWACRSCTQDRDRDARRARGPGRRRLCLEKGASHGQGCRCVRGFLIRLSLCHLPD